MEANCERNNMESAIKRVIRNKGAPGVDGMTVRKIKRYLERHWTEIEKAFCGTWWTSICKRFKQRVRKITARSRGRSLSQVINELKQFMNGW